MNMDKEKKSFDWMPYALTIIGIIAVIGILFAVIVMIYAAQNTVIQNEKFCHSVCSSNNWDFVESNANGCFCSIDGKIFQASTR